MTLNLDDLIKCGKETDYLDFKSIPYKKEKFGDFIKDVMSMANADIEIDRYLIIGVKTHPDREKELLGVHKSDFLDSATYQQLISDNIEPVINLECFYYSLDGKDFGIFKISRCFNQPYLMKKDYNPSLKKGDGYIRIGDHQRKLERQDYDRIFSKRINEKSFDGDVEIKFLENNDVQLHISPLKNFEFPSNRMAEKIKKILENRKQNPFVESNNLFALPVATFGSLPYEQRTTKDLEKNLTAVHRTYADEDAYELFEVNSHKINLLVENKGHQYIEDATIEMEIPKIDGVLIADQIYPKPQHQSSPFAVAQVSTNFNNIYYPAVKEEKNSFIISKTIGNIKHQIPTNVFPEPIRLVCGSKASGETIEIKCKIYAKNLSQPVLTTLKIVIDS
jgi:hypothetical protein